LEHVACSVLEVASALGTIADYNGLIIIIIIINQKTDQPPTFSDKPLNLATTLARAVKNCRDLP